jgi:long-chain acyl-CoA synthetase
MPVGDSAAPVAGGLSSQISQRARSEPEAPAVARREGDGWISVSAAAFWAEVIATANGLARNGIVLGNRVAIMSRNSYEWTLLDYALWTLGAVSVPIYDTADSDHLDWLLHDSGCSAAFVEFDSQVELLRTTHSDNQLRSIWSIESADITELTEQGRAEPDLAQIPDGRVNAESLATLIYTSGTTGKPKGCMITHGNLMFQAAAVSTALPDLFAASASTLLFLPLAHVYGRIIEVGALRSGVLLAHCPSQDALLADMQSFAPTFFPAVPRVFEKIYNNAQHEAVVSGRVHRFNAAADAAISYSIKQGGERLGIGLRTRHRVFDRFAYARLRGAMGDNVQYALSSGSALGSRLGHFYRGSGVPILEAYGLTESCGAVSMTSPADNQIGTVGKAIPGTELMLDDDGEILVRSPGVFEGYWNNSAATEAVLSPEGWLHTGDLGAIDGTGNLSITGRKKEIIVTAFGQRVAPALLEDRLRAHYLVSQCLIVGDKRPYVSCLITLDPDSLASWLSAAQKPPKGEWEQLRADPDLRAELQASIDEVNKLVTADQAITRFEVIEGDWTPEEGLVTPSMKLKRDRVLEDYQSEIAALYND